MHPRTIHDWCCIGLLNGGRHVGNEYVGNGLGQSGEGEPLARPDARRVVCLGLGSKRIVPHVEHCSTHCSTACFSLYATAYFRFSECSTECSTDIRTAKREPPLRATPFRLASDLPYYSPIILRATYTATRKSSVSIRSIIPSSFLLLAPTPRDTETPQPRG